MSKLKTQGRARAKTAAPGTEGRANPKLRRAPKRSRSNGTDNPSGSGDGFSRATSGAKDRILAAAMREFSTRGYDGARVDEIMRQSKVSKNLIYHYFINKERLFIAVLEAAYEKIRNVQTQWPSSFSSPTQGIRMLTRLIFEHWKNSPEFIGLLNSENFHRGRHLRKARRIKSGYALLITRIDEIIKKGQRSGEFRPDIDPVELYISISSLGYHCFSNQYTLLYLLGRDADFEEQTRSYLAHVEEVVLSYVKFGAPN